MKSLALLLVFGALCATLSAQSVPSLINYQGRLTDQTGNAMPAGAYIIQFRLWNDPVASTNLIWGQQQNLTVQSNGVFDVILGSSGGVPITSPTPQVNNLAYAFASPGCFLGVTVSAGPAGVIANPTEISPRQQLLSAPFAVQAQFAQEASSLVTNLANALCPPGTIVAYMGTNAPPGWMLCDGSPMSRTKFAALFSVTGTASGSGDGSTTFNLPDLRGMFLRGMNGSQTDTNYSDPDAQSRTNLFAGGNVGNAVGSVQLDGFQDHEHSPLSGNFLVYGSGAVAISGSGNGPQASSTGHVLPQSGVRVTSETRPKNVYVNFIIKY